MFCGCEWSVGTNEAGLTSARTLPAHRFQPRLVRIPKLREGRKTGRREARHWLFAAPKARQHYTPVGGGSANPHARFIRNFPPPRLPAISLSRRGQPDDGTKASARRLQRGSPLTQRVLPESPIDFAAVASPKGEQDPPQPYFGESRSRSAHERRAATNSARPSADPPSGHTSRETSTGQGTEENQERLCKSLHNRIDDFVEARRQ